jgi:predicted deacylase
MPGANWPAVLGRARTSPIDKQNLNRAFPGSPTGGPTAMIADFVERLLPEVQLAIDLHSGGAQSIFAPCGYVYAMGDAAFRRAKLEAAHAFGAPATAVVAATASAGSLSAACERRGVVMVAAELGGGARLDRDAMRVGEAATMNLLRHAGVLAGAPEARRTRLFHTASRRAHVMASIDGFAELVVDVGEDVGAGDLAARIWPMDDMEREPVELRFGVGGRVLATRTMPMVRRGDTLCHTGAPMSDEAFLGGAA